MQLALSGFLFEDGYKTQSISFKQFCAVASEAGYNGVELRQTQVSLETAPPQRNDLRKTAADHGLAITCLTARGMPDQEPERSDFVARYLQLCNDLGCGLLKVGLTLEDIEGSLSIANQAAKAGVRVGVNNHLGNVLETTKGTRRFLDILDHPQIGLLFDAMHLSMQGQSYLGLIPDVAARTWNILVQSRRHDGDASTPTSDPQVWRSCMPDEADQDWPAVLRGFHDQGYSGWVTVIENGWPPDQREAVARTNARFLLSHWDRI